MANHLGNESFKGAIGAGQATFPAVDKNQRESDRVFLSLHIRVTSVAEHGKDLWEEGRTVDVSRRGAAIMVDLELHAGQSIKIQRVGLGKEAMARVVGRIVGRSDAHVFGVALVGPAPNLWDIAFPDAPDLEKAVLRALLRCIACGRLEVSYLSEFETDLFLRHHCISRMCTSCGGWTTWTRPFGHTSTDPHIPVEFDSELQGLQQYLASGKRNLRSHDRIRVEAVGCVRHSALGNEVVLVRDLARGGLSFYSANSYPEGSRMEMAVPYASRAPNIYSPAKIVSSRKGAEKGLIEYGVAYLR
ncbi:MAG TPA: PilZ domain-containing protein [Candidatus Acidoferrum sp.]|nr:PilZ domain-containing protein [Candidatus Acidoferrum sp.]